MDGDRGGLLTRGQVDSKSTASLPMTGSLPLPDLNSRKAQMMQAQPGINYYENNVINVNNVMAANSQEQHSLSTREQGVQTHHPPTYEVSV